MAGIVGTGSERALALIELPDGRQRLFRVGDALGDGSIREITAAGVRVALKHEDLLLRLHGKPVLVTSAQDEPTTAGDETDPGAADDQGEVEHESEPKDQPAAADAARETVSAAGEETTADTSDSGQ